MEYKTIANRNSCFKVRIPEAEYNLLEKLAETPGIDYDTGVVRGGDETAPIANQRCNITRIDVHQDWHNLGNYIPEEVLQFPKLQEIGVDVIAKNNPVLEELESRGCRIEVYNHGSIVEVR